MIAESGAGASHRPRSQGGRALSVVLALALTLAATASIWWRAPTLPCGDLCSYYSAGMLVREGSAASVYDRAELERRHREVHDLRQNAGPFLYSPLLLLPAAWVATTPYPEAARHHRIAGALALALGLFAVLLALESLAMRIAVAGAFTLAHASWVQLIYANWSFFLFALTAAAMLALVRERAAPVALAGALAMHLKAFAIFAFVPLAFARRRLAVALVAVAVLLAALVLPFTGFAPWSRFGSFLAQQAGAGVTPYYSKSSLAANLARLSTEPRAWVAPRAPVRSFPVRGVFWAGLPLLAWASWRLRARPPAALACGIAWTLLFVPQIWEHTEILLFAALPALPRRYQGILAAMLALTFFYNQSQQELLAGALRGESAATPIGLLLWLYPALNLLAFAAALDRGDAGGRGAPPLAAADPAPT